MVVKTEPTKMGCNSIALFVIISVLPALIPEQIVFSAEEIVNYLTAYAIMGFSMIMLAIFAKFVS